MHKVRVNGQEPLELQIENGMVNLIDSETSFDIQKRGNGEWHLIVDGKSMVVYIDKINKEEKTMQAVVNGKVCEVKITDKMDLLLKSMGLENALGKKMNELKAPMPGLVLELKINIGDTVAKGDALLVLEAMKMENVIKAAGDGVESGFDNV
jgi:biotin carboxyl carrier protein